MHVVLNVFDRKVEFDLTYDPSFIADQNTWAVLQAQGACEPEVVQLMARVLREGDVAVDVGANIGFFTILMAKLVGPTGSVLAFEPGPQNKIKLADNVQFNKLTNVNLVHRPLWSEDATVTLHLAQDSGLNSLGAHEKIISSIEMQACSLDSYYTMRMPRLIKLDAEGSEEHILRGAERLLHEVPFIVCELNPGMLMRLGSSIHSLQAFMYSKGYWTFLLKPDGSVPVAVPSTSKLVVPRGSGNVLFAAFLDVALAWPEVSI